MAHQRFHEAADGKDGPAHYLLGPVQLLHSADRADLRRAQARRPEPEQATYGQEVSGAPPFFVVFCFTSVHSFISSRLLTDLSSTSSTWWVSGSPRFLALWPCDTGTRRRLTSSATCTTSPSERRFEADYCEFGRNTDGSFPGVHIVPGLAKNELSSFPVIQLSNKDQSIVADIFSISRLHSGFTTWLTSFKGASFAWNSNNRMGSRFVGYQLAMRHN